MKAELKNTALGNEKRKSAKPYFLSAAVLFILFILLTSALLTVDVRPAGPEGSEIGLAAVNCFVFESAGVNDFWHGFTEGLGMVGFAAVFGFALLGLVQLVRRKSLFRVDKGLFLLAGFYLVLAAVYVFFEIVVINFRPILMDGVLEASYPSSHTIFIIGIMGSSAFYILRRCRSHGLKFSAAFVSGAIVVFTVIGRLLSGVHWFTDILGGTLLGAALVMLYAGFDLLLTEKE